MTLGLDIAKIMRAKIIFKCKISSCSPYFKQSPGADWLLMFVSSCFRIVQHIHTINLPYHQRSPDLSINEAAALNWTLTGWKLRLLSLHTHTFCECGSVVFDFDMSCLRVYNHHPYWTFFSVPLSLLLLITDKISFWEMATICSVKVELEGNTRRLITEIAWFMIH